MLGDKSPLAQGAAGDEVASLQKKLVNLGLDVGTVDGKFGDKTKAAVEKFQNDYNLEVDGIVGAKTGAALEHYLKMKLEEQAQAAAQFKTTAKVMPTGGKLMSGGEATEATPAKGPAKPPVEKSDAPPPKAATGPTPIKGAVKTVSSFGMKTGPKK